MSKLNNNYNKSVTEEFKKSRVVDEWSSSEAVDLQCRSFNCIWDQNQENMATITATHQQLINQG